MTPDYKETMPREIWANKNRVWWEREPATIAEHYIRSDLTPAAINREMLSALKIMRRHVGSTCDYLHVKNDLDAADAAISKAEQAGDGWQTIDSAPKDGTRILVVDRDFKHYEVAAWEEFNGTARWYTVDAWTHQDPKYWQYLPPPQALKEKEKQQLFFKRMYSHHDLNLSIEDVIENMPDEKLDWALSQVEKTIAKSKDTP